MQAKRLIKAETGSLSSKLQGMVWKGRSHRRNVTKTTLAERKERLRHASQKNGDQGSSIISDTFVDGTSRPPALI